METILIEHVKGGWQITRDGRLMHTPKKNPMVLPTRALAEAIAEEWQEPRAFSSKRHPVTALAFTAIDVTRAHQDRFVQAMMAYAETDLLLYRSETPELRARQDSAWDEVVTLIQQRYDCTLEITEGVMPIEQPTATLARLQAALEAMETFTLAAFSQLTQSLGSLLLALAVHDRMIDAARAFRLSRVDEDFQTERWGEDSLALARARDIEHEITVAASVLRMV